MIDTKFIDDMVKRLSDAIPSSLKAMKKDLEGNFRSVLQSTFNRFDLITRAEFDAQAGVLAKTRAKLDKLEKHVAELEKHLSGKKTKSSHK